MTKMITVMDVIDQCELVNRLPLPLKFQWIASQILRYITSNKIFWLYFITSIFGSVIWQLLLYEKWANFRLFLVRLWTFWRLPQLLRARLLGSSSWSDPTNNWWIRFLRWLWVLWRLVLLVRALLVKNKIERWWFRLLHAFHLVKD